MKSLTLDQSIVRLRTSHPVLGYGDATCAFLVIRAPGAMLSLRVLASIGDGWEHVSVSTEMRCPTWEEMEGVRRLLWEPEATVVQYHPPLSEYVNNHPYTLHMWRPIGVILPRPPMVMV